MRKHIAIIFIGTSVYLKYFNRFYAAIKERFATEASRHFFVFTENHLSTKHDDVTVTKLRFANKRDVKLHKFHYINQIKADLGHYDYIFYFDADSILTEPIELSALEKWFESQPLVGVMHPWQHIRETDKRFEKNSVSAAYVDPAKYVLLAYHQSCFWGGRTTQVLTMSTAIEAMIDRDLAIGHVNEHMICDELYVNKYFVENASLVRSLDTSYAHPGSEYERITRREDRAGYRFRGAEVVVHDNANQTQSWKQISGDGAHFTHGAYAQFHRADLAAYVALQEYRAVNPKTPIHLISDGGDDLSSLATTFDCHYFYEKFNNGTRRTKHKGTNQYIWLQRLRDACLSSLSSVDWVILLEPDVECFNAPKHFPQYVLAGPSPGPAWTPELKEMFSRKFGRLTRSLGLGHNFTGCGGSIFNRQVFLDCFTQTPLSVFDEAAKLDPRILEAEDVTLTFLFQINGFDTGRWEDFTGWRDENKKNFATAHGNKQFYGKPIIAKQECLEPQLMS